MTQLQGLRIRRDEILKEITALEQIRRGSVVEQFVETVKADGSKVRRGPYALYSYKEKKKTVSRRVSNPELVKVYRKQIKAFRRYQELSAELICIGEKISDMIISEGDDKKNSRSRYRTR
ncbi:hypothetical protein BMS3Bbin06_00446 [bacterium BMS3Bbin06]|nr:hypothetical protein BMS3Abin08_02162 [bacterium BMS3Abin08]GBE33931.1 hypothetical protein BMS3Bbin06_00446 [bacterium BMS3Bbin06]HDO35935.1 hypothetical protein [Nitrospirota bacterium]HDY71518.1 hypothetical protein [Nitrospirota bacterium]